MPLPNETASNVPALEDINLFSTDVALQEGMTREGAGAAAKRLAGFGLVTGSAEAFAKGRLANAHAPRLVPYDRNGQPSNHIDYHPAYHDLMAMCVFEGLTGDAWQGVAGAGPSLIRAGANVERAGALYLAAQVDAGHVRSISMAHACVAALSHNADLTTAWLPKIVSRSYDPRPVEAATKTSLTLSLALAGPDYAEPSSEAIRAVPTGDKTPSPTYALSGVKGLIAAPSSDGLIILATTGSMSASCFLLPGVIGEDVSNSLAIRRLHQPLGMRSCALAEIEFSNSTAWMLGEEGCGREVLKETIMHARLDTVVVVAALMRQCVAQAIHFCEYRRAGAQALIAQPLIHQTLADMALDVEAVSALAFRLARAFDRSTDARAAAWRRLMTPVSAYWASRRGPVLAAEAVECLGGNGSLEDWPIARLYRDLPVAAMADGTSNTMALDVLHILQREPDVAETVMEELGQAAGDDNHLRAAHTRVESLLHEPRYLDSRARQLVEELAVLAAGTILRAHAPQSVADAFIVSRSGAGVHQTYGQGLEWAETRAIVERASPHLALKPSLQPG